MKGINLSLLFAAGLLFSTSCSTNVDEWFAEPQPDTNKPGDSEEATLNLTITTEAKTASSRAEVPDYNISDGKKTDVLIFAVYSVNKDEDGEITSYTLLDQYGNDAGGTGQAKYTGVTFPKTDISLRLMRGKEYQIAFWAQNSDCNAYTTTDLETVKVSYENAKNNDELRDAFCKSVTVNLTGDEELDVILTRPLAQINAGTAGWDWEDQIRYNDGKKYLYSTITLSGVPQSMNVLENTINTTDLTNVTYSYAQIPSYIYTGIPSNFYNPTVNNPKEQFLKVDLTGDGEFMPYLSEIPEDDSTLQNKDGIFTETFKYLSMCYILAPDAPETDSEGTVLGAMTLDNVVLTVSTNTSGGDAVVKTINNVPFQRNWRTNILWGTGVMKGDTPEVDGNPFFEDRDPQIILRVDKAPGYTGDHNVD